MTIKNYPFEFLIEENQEMSRVESAQTRVGSRVHKRNAGAPRACARPYWTCGGPNVQNMEIKQQESLHDLCPWWSIDVYFLSSLR